jgi:uncharacterized membrane protein YkvA (DUF1232 family)
MDKQSKPISAFEKLKKRAESMLKDPEAALNVVDEAAKKAKREAKRIDAVKEDFTTLIQMLKAYFKGEYRMVPWTTIISSLAAVLYFVNPFDVIPDLIVGFGMIDDATVIAFCLRSIKKDLDEFTSRKSAQKPGPAVEVPVATEPPTS